MRGKQKAQKENYEAFEDNTMLIEWVSEIYGIFWGIWLGFTTDRIVTSCEAPFHASAWVSDFLKMVFPFLPVSLWLLITAYSYYLVKWLWSMRFIEPASTYRVVFGKLKNALLFWLVMTLGVVLLGYTCSIALHWVWMGVWSTLGWLMVVSVVVLVDKRGWK